MRAMLFRIDPGAIYLSSHLHFAHDHATYRSDKCVGHGDAINKSIPHVSHYFSERSATRAAAA